MITEDVEDNALNSSDNEGVDGGVQNKREKEKKKKKLYEVTKTHELLAKTFYMTKLKESMIIFSESNSNSK
jgi:hypothetical protein